jgi:hypothetical protein
MFKENFRLKMAELNMTSKDVANSMIEAGYSFEAKLPYRIVQSWVQKKAYLPNVTSGYAIAKALKTTLEELVDGESGAEYIRGLVRNDPKTIQVPDKILPNVEGLLELGDNDLNVVQASIRAMIINIKGKAQEAA